MTNNLINVESMPVAMREAMQAEMEKSKGVAAGVGSGTNLPRLSIAGKEFSIRVGGQSQSLRTFTLDVIIADARPNVSKLYYEGVYDPSKTAGIPDCASVDGVKPDFVPAIIDKTTGKCPHNCKECYFNQLGTALQGKGKACKDYKRMIVLLAGTEQNPFDPNRPPLALDLPATSMKAPKGSAGVMMFKEFTEACQRNNMPISMVVAELSFMSGTAFSQLCMRPKRIVTEEEYNRVLAVREEQDVISALNDRYEPKGEDLPEETAEALAKPAPVAEPATPAEKPVEQKVQYDEIPFEFMEPSGQKDALNTVVGEKPKEVSAKEAEAAEQLDAFFASL